MDKRFLAIITICLVETLLRLAYPHVSMAPVVYTLLARGIEIAIMLTLAFSLCGLKTAGIRKEIMIGAAMAAAFGTLVLAGDLLFRLFSGAGLLRLLVGRMHVESPFIFFMASCLIAPLAEEMFFRGLFYEWIRLRFPVPAAIILSALFFAAMHGQIAIVQLVGGLMFAGLYEWRRSIWAPFVLHAAANLGIWIIPQIYPLY